MGASLTSLQFVASSIPLSPPPGLRGGELPESEAWTIATTWTQQLKRIGTSVRLVIDRSSSPAHSIIDSYAWVRFELPYAVQENSSPHEIEKARHAASVVRATALTWRALASCRGYSARDRPAFWKRVFYALEPTKPPFVGPFSEAYAARVRDSISFFDECRFVFPRVMVATSGRVFTPQIRAVLDSLCGFPDECSVENQVEATLAQLLGRLEPVKDTMRRRAQSIDLCLSVPSSVLTRTTPQLSAIVQAINASASTVGDEHNAIHDGRTAFHLQQLRLEGLVKFDDDEDTHTISSFVDRLCVPVGPCRVSFNVGDTSVAGFAKALTSILDLNKRRHAATTTLAFQYERLADRNIQALFSALPFTSSVHAVNLSVRSEMRPFDVRELPWIAYAIFHPRASRSAWRQLELKDLTLRSEAKQVLAAMARGNNLLALLTGEKPTCDAYVSATINGGSIVYTKPSDTAPPLVAIPSAETLEVDVCGVSSTSSVAAWSEWVAVVVPAYGLGWVRSASVVSALAQEPSTSQLTAMRLERRAHSPSADTERSHDSCESLMVFIKELRTNLACLDIDSFGAIQASTVHCLLESCPDLKVLKAEFVGVLSCSATMKTKLQELALRISAPNGREVLARLPVQWTRQLNALRLTFVDPTAFQHNHRQVAQLLAHATNLQYLHWHYHEVREQARAHPPMANEMRHQLSTSAIYKLNVLRGTNVLHAQGAFRASCAAAMVSVVAYTRRADEENARGSDSAMGRLHTDVLRHIFQFATSPVRRTICIEQD